MIKKPELTKGEWTHSKDGLIWRQNYKGLHEYGGDIMGDQPVANTNRGSSHWENEFNFKSNAQAISAVPGMIDTLIYSYEELESLMEVSHWTKEAENAELMQKMKLVLEKAGCKFA